MSRFQLEECVACDAHFQWEIGTPKVCEGCRRKAEAEKLKEAKQNEPKSDPDPPPAPVARQFEFAW